MHACQNEEYHSDSLVTTICMHISASDGVRQINKSSWERFQLLQMTATFLNEMFDGAMRKSPTLTKNVICPLVKYFRFDSIKQPKVGEIAMGDGLVYAWEML